MNPELIEQLKDMTEAERSELLNTQFPEEMEKEAEAAVTENELTDALYTYGWLAAERALAESEGAGDLSKVASAEDIQAHEAAEAEVAAMIEADLQALAIADSEDEVVLHKTAQACAVVIFEGYTDAIEKIAKAKGKDAKSLMQHVKALAGGAKKKMKAGVKEVKRFGKKHGPGAAGGLVAGGAIGAAGANKMHEKRAADLSVGELIDVVSSINELDQGVEKLASAGAAKGEALKALIGE